MPNSCHISWSSYWYLVKSILNEAPQNARNKHYIGKKIIGYYMKYWWCIPQPGRFGCLGKIFPMKQLKYFEVQNSSLRQLNLIMFLGIDIFMAINIKVGLNNVRSAEWKPVFWRNLLSIPSRVHHVHHILHIHHVCSQILEMCKRQLNANTSQIPLWLLHLTYCNTYQYLCHLLKTGWTYSSHWHGESEAHLGLVRSSHRSENS
jgi:hypothetical protein